jgi:hypothetical protein
MTDEDNEALLVSIAEMKQAIAEAIIQWSWLEHALAGILDHLFEGIPSGLGTVVYYAPNNTETRIRMVDRALTFVPKGSGPKVYEIMHSQRIEACWHKLLNRAKEVRNKIVHGQVVGMKGKARLISDALFDPSERNPLSWAAKAWDSNDRPPQLPGMSINDVAGAAKKFAAHTDNCTLLSLVILFHQNLAIHREEFEARLLELEDRLKVTTHPQVSPISLVHRGPPESS